MGVSTERSSTTMATTLGKVLVAVASLAMLHAAYSSYEYLSALKALGKPEGSLPTSIIFEAILSLVLFLPGAALSTGPLEDVTYRGEIAKRTVENSDARMAFMSLKHRGALLFGDDAGKPKSS